MTGKLSKTNGTVRIPPMAVEIEAAVISSVIMEPDMLDIVLGDIQPEFLYQTSHRAIFTCIRDMHRAGKPVDIITLENELSSRGELDAAGGVVGLHDIIRIGITGNIDYYCQVIREYATKRTVIAKSLEWSDKAFENEDVFELIGKIEQDLSEVHDMSFTSAGSDVSTLSGEVFEMIRTRKDLEGVTGISTGLTDLNAITAGWQPSDLIILAARPSMGKTALILECSTVAAEAGPAVGMISLEMSDHQLTQRLLIQKSGVDGEKVRLGRLSPHELMALEKAKNRLEQLSIYIDDTPSMSIAEITARAKRWKREKGIGLLIVDYLQLATSDRVKGDNREQEISAISRGLKGLAKNLNIPVIALSQLSRAVELRGGDKRPQLSDLRESGSIEQDADMVIFLYRPEYYGTKFDASGNSTEGVAELIVAKQRNGRVGDARAFYDKPTMRFRDLSRESEPVVQANNFYETDNDAVF